MTRPATALLVGGVLLAAARLAQGAEGRDETLTLTLDSGRMVQATVRIPASAPSRMPALMLFGGFQHAAEVLERVREPRALIWATFDYPFEPPRKFRFPHSLGHAPQLRDAIHDTFDGIAKLHAALRARPDVDPRRITVVGASAGAPFATVAAARGGIPGAILVQGAADLPRVVENLLVRKRAEKYGQWIRWPARALANLLIWYCRIPDIAAAARSLRADQHVLLVTASEDDYIPREATEALWRALEQSSSQRQRIDLPGAHLGVGDDRARIAEILQRSMAWLAQRGLL